jgi:hypothetical protein
MLSMDSVRIKSTETATHAFLENIQKATEKR